MESKGVKVSDYIMDRLASWGIRHVFMVTGGGAMHLVDSVGRSRRLSYTCTHHEQAAAIAAEGYFRASGRMAAVVVTSGPGGTNTLTGVIGQWLDSIPAIYVSGQVKQSTTIAACPDLKLRQLGDQEINIVDIVRPVTKYAVMVRDPLDIRRHLEAAFRLATGGQPGPVWLDVPLDVQAARVREDALRAPDPDDPVPPSSRAGLRRQVEDLLDRIRRAERPVLMAGHGIRLAGAERLFLRLAARLNVPVLTAICGHDLIPSDHRLFFGRPGICGDRVGNMVLQNSDFFLAVGARLGIRNISYNYDGFARNAFRAMVDIDPDELKKPTLRLDLAVEADAKDFIEEMLRRTGASPLPPKRPWLRWCRNVQRALPTLFEDNPSKAGWVNSYVFADALFRQMKAGDLVVTGNGTAYTSTFQAMRIRRGVRVFANQACASMGYDLPAAIGACLARRKKPVVLITGDGSIQMNIQELQTIAVHRLPIKTFVLNNRGYLAIRLTQDTYFDGRHVGSDPESGVVCPDIRRVARAYGLRTFLLRDERSLPRSIESVLRADGPALCEVRMHPDQTLYPKLSSEVQPDGTMVSKPLEDMYPFIPRALFDRLMKPPCA